MVIADVNLAAAAAKAVEAFGAVHLLVNNAGVVTNHSFDTLTENAWDFVVRSTAAG